MFHFYVDGKRLMSLSLSLDQGFVDRDDALTLLNSMVALGFIDPGKVSITESKVVTPKASLHTQVGVAGPPVVYRGIEQALEQDAPPREPQKKPKLLVLDRPPTAEETGEYLMIVAEGHIVKNAYGALELEDMPLSSEEGLLVRRALGESK